MDFAEFQKMLLESLKNNDIKSEMLKLLSDDNVSEQLESYEKKIKELEQKLAESSEAADKKYSELLSEFNDISGTSAAIKLELEDKNKIIDELNGTIAKMNASGSDSEKIAADRISRLTKELDDLKADLAAKESRISALSSSENSLKAQIQSLSGANDNMKKQLDNSDSEKNAEIVRLNEKITSLSADLENEKKIAAQKSEAAQSCENEIAKLKNENAELDAKLADANGKAASIEAAASAKNEELSRSIAEMDVKIVGYVSEIDKAKNEIEQKNKIIEDLKASADSHSSELAAKTAEISEALAAEKNKNDRLSTEIDTYKSQAENIASKLAEAEAKIKEAQEEAAHKDSTIASMNTQLQGMLVLRQKINEYAETANAYAAEVENARSILTERDSAINSLNAQVNALNSQNAELSGKVTQYSEALDTKNTQIDELGKYAESLKAHAEELSAQVIERNTEITQKTDEIAELKSQIEAYNLTFGDLTSMYNKFQNLAPNTKAGLKEVFTENLTVRSFLSSGAQWGHIQALWEFTQQKINDEDFTDVQTLNEIFKYFLDFHNSSYPTPLYALLDTKPGDAFDEDIHSKIMSREERKAAFFAKNKAPVADGPIKEVVLYGYKNLRNGRVLKPSIVRV